MISIGKAPYRISLLGGGSDLDWFLQSENNGISLGYSLKKYSYSVVNILDKRSTSGQLNYSVRENYRKINEIVHPLIREALKISDMKNYIELTTYGFATGGSGLGGSSSFLLSLLAALKNNKNFKLVPEELAAQACEIEINRLNKPIGRQDQYISALGGISCLYFSKSGSVEKSRISTNKETFLKRQIDNLFLIPSFKTRSADKVLQNLKDDKSSISKLKQIREITTSFINSNGDRDFKIEEKFHQSVRDSWEIKRSMTNVMDSLLEDQLEEISTLIPNNWIRLLGAGSGGYFLISPKTDPSQTKNILEDSKFDNFVKADMSTSGVTLETF